VVGVADGELLAPELPHAPTSTTLRITTIEPAERIGEFFHGEGRGKLIR
jgi:hypothetical protein